MEKLTLKDNMIFIADQDGEVEQEFKRKLTDYFLETNKHIRAYLVQAQYPNDSFNVVLCLKLQNDYDEMILKDCVKIFQSMFNAKEHLDICFITDSREVTLRQRCCPFYTSRNFQVQIPDFYLTSSEGYGLSNRIIKCFKQKKLYGKHLDGYLLCDIAPTISDISSQDISQVIFASRHKGISLFPVTDWPAYVHVAKPLIKNIGDKEFIDEFDVELIAWAEIYKDKEEIKTNNY